MLSIRMQNLWKYWSVLIVFASSGWATYGETTCILRPNANINQIWSTYKYENIADDVVNPGTPSIEAVTASRSDDDEEQIWGFTGVSNPDIASVTAVHLNIHAKGGHLSGVDPEFRIESPIRSTGGRLVCPFVLWFLDDPGNRPFETGNQLA